jgi:hypothetical protein
MSCNSKLAAGFTALCGVKPKQGVLAKWYINYDDIDRAATTLANKKTKITSLILKEDAVIYPAEGNDKAHKNEHALAVGDFGNGYLHTDRYAIAYRGDDEGERVQELVNGARVVTISRMVFSGDAGELAFKVAGYESGMVIAEDTFNSAENSGVSQIACATKEGEEEATGLKTFMLAGGLAATEAWILANTYVEPV